MAQMLLGERICFLLELRDVSKKELCETLHIHPSTFSGYLSGNRQPSFDILMQLADYFGTTCDYLLGYTPKTDDFDCISTQEEHTVMDLYRIMAPEHREIWLETGKVMCRHQKKS